MATYEPIQKNVTTSGWGLFPGATSQNLSRSLKGSNEGYGGLTQGVTSDAISKRREQIAQNFAIKQAQIAEAERAQESQRAYDLAERGMTERERAAQSMESQRKAEWEAGLDWREKDYLFSKEKWEDAKGARQAQWDYDSAQNEKEWQYKMQQAAMARQDQQDAQNLAYQQAKKAASAASMVPAAKNQPGSRGYKLQTGRNGQRIWVDIATGQAVSSRVATGRGYYG